MNKIIYNPFEKFSEVQLFASGLALAIGGSLLGFLFHSRFDGILDVHPDPGVLIHQPFIDNAINTVSLFLLLLLLGYIVNKKTRAIDILNTSLIARSPFYLLAIGNSNDFFSKLEAKINPGNPLDVNFTALDFTIITVFSIFSIAFLVWFAALLYNGFKTATNVKAISHKIAFGFAIILAEVLSKIIMSLLNY
jgi:hypothetical protein